MQPTCCFLKVAVDWSDEYEVSFQNFVFAAIKLSVCDPGHPQLANTRKKLLNRGYIS